MAKLELSVISSSWVILRLQGLPFSCSWIQMGYFLIVFFSSLKNQIEHFSPPTRSFLPKKVWELCAMFSKKREEKLEFIYLCGFHILHFHICNTGGCRWRCSWGCLVWVFGVPCYNFRIPWTVGNCWICRISVNYPKGLL